MLMRYLMVEPCIIFALELELWASLTATDWELGWCLETEFNHVASLMQMICTTYNNNSGHLQWARGS